jgi:hypothetical protein
MQNPFMSKIQNEPDPATRDGGSRRNGHVILRIAATRNHVVNAQTLSFSTVCVLFDAPALATLCDVEIWISTILAIPA